MSFVKLRRANVIFWTFGQSTRPGHEQEEEEKVIMTEEVCPLLDVRRFVYLLHGHTHVHRSWRMGLDPFSLSCFVCSFRFTCFKTIYLNPLKIDHYSGGLLLLSLL